jgi:hypothetical protein
MILRLNLSGQDGGKPVKAEARYYGTVYGEKAQVPGAGVVFKKQIEDLRKRFKGTTRIYSGNAEVWEFDARSGKFEKSDIAPKTRVKIEDIVYGKHKACFPRENCFPYFAEIAEIGGKTKKRLIIYGASFEEAFPAGG